MITLTIDGIPLPWKAPFVGKRGAFNPRWKDIQIMRQMVAEQYCGPILESAVDCHINFFVPIPKATSKKKREMMLSGLLRPITRGDRTNYAKLYEDILIGIVYKDDSQIVGGEIAKYYSEKPRTFYRIEPI